MIGDFGGLPAEGMPSEGLGGCDAWTAEKPGSSPMRAGEEKSPTAEASARAEGA